MREGEEEIDNEEVLARELRAVKEQQRGLPKTEREPAGMNPCVDIIRKKREARLNLHVRAAKEPLTVNRIDTEHKP